MNTTKKLTTVLLALITTSMAFAYDFEVDGICYLVNGSEVTVTSRTPLHVNNTDYTGDVVIPETVTYQGVTYPVTAIGGGAFYWCTELTSIHIPKSVKRIEGQYVFYACENLSVVEIESLESWCNIDFAVTNGYDFSYSNPLSYAHHLYINSEELTELVIPSGVTKIGTSAFCNLSFLSRLEIPTSVTSIGDAAFARCGGFDSLDIPDLESWMKIDIQGWKSNPMGYARKIYLDGVEMSSDLVIPDTITKISANAFHGCNIIKSVSIPSSIEAIGSNAFLDCDSLEKVDIQDFVAWCNIVFENAGSNPISNGIISGLDVQRVTIYVNGSPITQLDVPEGLTSIGAYAFAGAQFEHVSFPNTLVSIGNGAFLQSWLEEVILPDHLKSLGIGAFDDCNYLKKVKINAGLEVIPEVAFRSCNSLTDVSLPSTVKEIELQAFYGCWNLTTMPMTDSLQIIGPAAFHSTAIEYLKTGKSLTSIGGVAFACCGNLKTVEIGDQVTSLGQSGTFAFSYSLQTVIVGNGVHRIPEIFCSDCEELISVTLGSAVDTLDAQCFKNCNKLNTIICEATVPPVMNGEEDFFPSAVYQNATLYVPYVSLQAYKTANIWENFQNIVSVNNVLIPADVNGDGEVNMADVNNLIDVVIMGGNSGHTRVPAYEGELVGDVNGDGEITIADVNAIIDMILHNN